MPLTAHWQLCTAPDYVVVTDGRQNELIAAFEEVYKEFFPEDSLASNSICHLINERHFDRVVRLLDNSKGKVVLGGERTRDIRFIAPTIVKDVPLDDSLMSECVQLSRIWDASISEHLCLGREIFGPVLPIIPVKDLQAAVDVINKFPKPLQLNIFSTSTKNKEFSE